MKRILFLFIGVTCLGVVGVAQNTYYYKLTKQKIGGIISTNVEGGQFFTFVNNACYESDIEGISVGNGVMNYGLTEDGIKIYTGDSYYGYSALYVLADKSKINIKHNNDIYVYERVEVPDGITTCSLVKQRTPNVNNNYYPCPINPVYVDNSQIYNNQSFPQNNPVQETPIQRRKCVYCSGTGKREYNQSVPTFGLPDTRFYCNECGREFYRSSGHCHVVCGYCGGTGYAK